MVYHMSWSGDSSQARQVCQKHDKRLSDTLAEIMYIHSRETKISNDEICIVCGASEEKVLRLEIC